MTIRVVAGMAVAVLLSLAVQLSVLASGGEFTSYQTFTTGWPVSRAGYAKGAPGIVKPGFSTRDLIDAYRVLNGGVPASFAADGNQAAAGYESPASTRFWEAVPRVSSERRLFVTDWRVLPDNSTFVNCNDATWATALVTLNARVASYGAGSREVAEWLRGQLDVIRNCGGDALTVPAPVPEWADATLRADRRYQVAAAYFYGMRYEEAARRFLDIAADAASPWRRYGHYLAARAMIRQATVVADASQEMWFSRAREELQRVTGDTGAASLHASAVGLIDLIDARTHPAERMHALAARLTGTEPLTGGNEFNDYLWLLRRTAPAPGVSEDELTDWLATLRSGSGDTAAHALQRWRDVRSQAWLVAAWWAAPPAAAPADLIAAADRLPRTSPAFATVTALRIRNLIVQGQDAEASMLLATLPARLSPGVDPELMNLVRAARLRLARTFPVFRDNLLRQAFSLEGKLVPSLDDDAAVLFNRELPLPRWLDTAESPQLPKRVRIRLAQVAFTRAVILDRSALALRAASTLGPLAPTLRDDLTRYIEASDERARHRAGVLLLLRTPGMMLATSGLESEYPELPEEPHRSYRNYAGYWWCSADVRPESPLTQFLFGNRFPPPSFLSAAERAGVARDLDRLNQHADGAAYLTTEVLAWARSSPDDPLVPEILSRAVRGWRFAHCNLARDSSLTKRAFQLLHTKYPQSEWAGRTPYWYE